MAELSSPILVVGVGASAGGLEAFKQLLAMLPSDSGMTFLIVQHLDPTHKSVLAELLSSHTNMVVQDADQDASITPNTIYVIRPDTALAVHNNKIELTIPTLHRGVRLPVDHLFQSLAREYASRAVGIVLSGAGSDGSTGLRAIKAAGGLTIAQEPASCGQSGMPQSAIDTGFVDLVLEINEMPAALSRFASLPPQPQIEESEQDEALRTNQTGEISPEVLRQLTALLEAQLNFDLQIYKSSMIERRLNRRMVLSGLETAGAYLDHLRHEPKEQQQLIRDLLISVTEFFRDKESYQALRELVIEPLVVNAAPGTTLRIWVAGCATGEEAYSIAIEILDAIESQNKRLELQIFATDVDQDALAFARTAIYPPNIAEQIAKDRLNKYFKPLDGKGYQVRGSLRDTVSFAVHDLTKDPPFSRMNLVSCRNLLIYLTYEAQRQVLGILHFALEADGHLFLSNSESIGPQKEMYSTISKNHRIYKKIGRSRPIAVSRSRTRSMPTSAEPAVSQATLKRLTSADIARRALLNACLPASIVISGEGTLLYSHGELGRYLRFPQDEGPRFELSHILRPELATRTRGVLYRCRRNHEVVMAIYSPGSGHGWPIRITARPAEDLGDGAAILTFEDIVETEIGPTQETNVNREHELVAEQLEKELQATREDLRNTVEELETSNEELRSSNEESMSMNEELQSTNEELEATTEELRSLNEELTTVNAQLREKVDQVERAHDDLNNFMTSTKVPTVFLDEQLCIKRFTPAARELLSIDEGDVGRSIGMIARELLQYDLEHEAKRVLEEFSPKSREIRTKNDLWMVRQVLPYRTEYRRIEGVVVTFTDVTELKVATERLADREVQQATIARLGLLALNELRIQEFMNHVVQDMQATLEADYCLLYELQPGNETFLLRAGRNWKDTNDDIAEDASADSPAGYALNVKDTVIFEDLSDDARFQPTKLLEELNVTSGMLCVVSDGDYHYGVLGIFTKERYRFTSEDTHYLQAVTNVVGSAISRHQTRVRLALELGVAHVLTEAVELDETLGLLLERMAKELGSSMVAELWINAKNELERKVLYVAPPSERSKVERHFSLASIESGRGLVGSVFETGNARWYTDLGSEPLFKRAEGAKIIGITTGFALPILSSQRVIGVIALFATERLFADEHHLRSLESMGRTIGDFMDRWQQDQEARHLSAVIASSHDAILSYNQKGIITAWLPGAESLYGYTHTEMLGESIYRIVPQDRRAELQQITQQIINGETVDPFETVRMTKTGTFIDVSVRSSPVKTADGKVIGISATDRDVTRSKNLERKLIEADKQKDEFLAMLSHELRNPLATIRHAADILKSDASDSRQHRAVEILDKQTSHIAKLLDGLLDISRIIRGRIHLERKIFNLAALGSEMVEELTEKLASATNKVSIINQVSEEPIWVNGDPVRLAQVMDNLLTNASRYTDEGSITVALTAEGNSAVFKVKDTGVGISEDVRHQLFKVFKQSKQGLARSRGGLGLGLALVKILVDLHGGSVEAKSAGEGKGAELIVRIPRINEAFVNQKTQVSDAPKNYHILIIEDNADAATMLQYLLESAGHKVEIATCGKKGVSMAKKLHPDVVLCDLGLPDLTGFDVAKALRADPAMADKWLIALSGYGRSEDKERAKDAGFDKHLTKPTDAQGIQAALDELERDGHQ